MPVMCDDLAVGSARCRQLTSQMLPCRRLAGETGLLPPLLGSFAIFVNQNLVSSVLSFAGV